MLNEKGLHELLAEVEREFTAQLAKSEQTSSAAEVSEPLAKAEEEPKKEKMEEESEKEEDSKEHPSKEEKEDEKSSESEEKEESKDHAPEEKEEAVPADKDAHDYDEQDMHHLHEMYKSMSKKELKLHHDAIKKCFGGMSQEEVAATAPMAKSEEIVKVEQTNEQVELLKSESVKKDEQIQELKKNLDEICGLVKNFINKKPAPQAKAITSLDVITKSEESLDVTKLSKNEITAILSRKVTDPSLTKSDRDLINNFYFGKANVESISHLLSGK